MSAIPAREKDKLLKEIWGDAFVEEANLARNIWTLRKALGDEKSDHRFYRNGPQTWISFHRACETTAT